jgi:arginyl-tRNA synthetase
MTSLTEVLSGIVGDAFAACGLPPELGLVRVSDRADLAQFQCNGAMAAGKLAKKNPRAVAEEVVAKLKERAEFARIEIAGPGFINLNMTNEYLAGFLGKSGEMLGVEPVGRGQTAVLDYGGPNIAKPMHVGHLRSAIIGDSIRKIMKFAGFNALGDVHMGDWGTQMGMIISEYIDTGSTEEILNCDLSEEFIVDKLMQNLSEVYPRVSAACKQDPVRKARALDATVRIQNKEGDYYKLWRVIREASMRGMRQNYELLGVHFDLWKGEADVHDLIPVMVEKLRQKGYAVEDDGALIIPLKRDDDAKEFPPLILHKRDGAVMYGTTDLATIVERVDLYHPSKIIYVVDQRQYLHFEQVFRAAKLSGIVPEDIELTHAGFGTMNGSDGRPFKTREGGVMELEDLILMGKDKASQRLSEAKLAEDLDGNAYRDVAHKVAIAAIKFADLQNQRLQDYVFDLDRLTSFEGKTGPYLLYQAVRIKSLLRKAEWTTESDDRKGRLEIGDLERPLALLLTEFPDAFGSALKHYMPHHLCDYAFRLAQQFSSFYASCHILSETDAAVKESRLALCAMTVRVLETALGLLGIDVPEKM